ncbi:hypothetical protein ACOSQ4_005193 [Xanthoceras sorbifolium]
MRLLVLVWLIGFGNAGKLSLLGRFLIGCRKNLVLWNAMINGYMNSRDFESARMLFNEMPVRNLITYNAIIVGFEANGRFKEAFKLFETMLDGDVVPNVKRSLCL